MWDVSFWVRVDDTATTVAINLPMIHRLLLLILVILGVLVIVCEILLILLYQDLEFILRAKNTSHSLRIVFVCHELPSVELFLRNELPFPIYESHVNENCMIGLNVRLGMLLLEIATDDVARDGLMNFVLLLLFKVRMLPISRLFSIWLLF